MLPKSITIPTLNENVSSMTKLGNTGTGGTYVTVYI